MDPIEDYIQSLKPEHKTCAINRLIGVLSSMVTDEEAQRAIDIAKSHPYYPMSFNTGEYEPF